MLFVLQTASTHELASKLLRLKSVVKNIVVCDENNQL